MVAASCTSSTLRDDSARAGAGASRAAKEKVACPTAQNPGRFPARKVAEAIRRELPRAFRDMNAQGQPNAWRDYFVIALFSLDPAFPPNPVSFPPRLLDRYRSVAADRCGRTVAERSWVALIHFPNAAGALLGEGVAYLVRTPRRWRIWYRALGSELAEGEIVTASGEFVRGKTKPR